MSLINVSTYRPLSGSSCVQLPVRLRSPKKGLIDINNNDENVFYGVMLGILILEKYIQEELHKTIKNLLVILILMGLSFLCEKKILARLKKRTVFSSMCIVMKISYLFESTFQIKNLKTR